MATNRLSLEIIPAHEDALIWLSELFEPDEDGDYDGYAEDIINALKRAVADVLYTRDGHSYNPIIRVWKQNSQEQSIQVLANLTGIGYNTLIKAVREGRLKGRKTGRIWLSTEQDVDDAIQKGGLRPSTP